LDFPTALRLPCRSVNHAAGSIRQNPAIPDIGKGEWLAPVKGSVAKPNGKLVFSSLGSAAPTCPPSREGGQAESGTMPEAKRGPRMIDAKKTMRTRTDGARTACASKCSLDALLVHETAGQSPRRKRSRPTGRAITSNQPRTTATRAPKLVAGSFPPPAPDNARVAATGARRGRIRAKIYRYLSARSGRARRTRAPFQRIPDFRNCGFVVIGGGRGRTV
jgi:hypothetical protein